MRLLFNADSLPGRSSEDIEGFATLNPAEGSGVSSTQLLLTPRDKYSRLISLQNCPQVALCPQITLIFHIHKLFIPQFL